MSSHFLLLGLVLIILKHNSKCWIYTRPWQHIMRRFYLSRPQRRAENKENTPLKKLKKSSNATVTPPTGHSVQDTPMTQPLWTEQTCSWCRWLRVCSGFVFLYGRWFKLHSRGSLYKRRWATEQLKASICFKPNACQTVKLCLQPLFKPTYVTGRCVDAGSEQGQRVTKTSTAYWHLQLTAGTVEKENASAGTLSFFYFQKDSFKPNMATDIETYIVIYTQTEIQITKVAIRIICY